MSGCGLKEPLDPSAPLCLAIKEATRPEEDDDAYWVAIERLRKEGIYEAWGLVAPLVRDERPEVRALVPDTLRYFSPHPLREDTATLLARMLATEESPLVLAAIAAAFVDLRHERAAELLPVLLRHADAKVRHAAISGLLTVIGPSTVPSVLLASTDPDEDVRNWGTFGLRMLLGEAHDADALDTEEVRRALAARLTDSVAEIRAEAILALATRQDERALEPLKGELRCWPEWDHCIEAAQHFSSSELFPLLSALLEEHPEEEPALRAALEACKPSA
jgi:HEAT repeat protein